MARLTPLLMIAVLVGCSDTSRNRLATDSARSEVTPGVAAPQVVQWIANPDSLGPVPMGRLYSTVGREYGAPERPLSTDPEESACDYVDLPGLPAGVLLMVFGDTIVRADIDTTGVLTRDGLGVGSPESALLSAYKGRVMVKSHPYDGPEWHYVVVTPSNDSTFRMIFETDGQRVRSFRIGLRRAVDLIEGCS